MANAQQQQTTSAFIDHDMDVVAADKKLIEQSQNSAPIGLTTDDVNKAIDNIFDIQERALLHFIWLGDMAKTFKEKRQTSVIDKIELAIPSRSMTPEVTSLFKTWNFEKKDYGYYFEYAVPLKWTTRLPVHIYIYHHKFSLFDNPDTVWAGVDYSYIPNPFDIYWQQRGIILHKLQTGKSLSKEPF